MQTRQKNPPGDSQPLPPQPHLASNAQPNQPPFSIRQHVLACRRRDVISNWPFPKKYLHFCFNRGFKEVLPPFESHESALRSIRGYRSLDCAPQEETDIGALFRNISLDTSVLENECECVLNTTEPSISELSIPYHNSSLLGGFHDQEENETSLNPEVDSHSIVICATEQPSATAPSSENKNELISPQVASSSSVVVSADQPSSSIQTTITLSSIRKLCRKEARRNGKNKKRTMAAILDVAKPSTTEDPLRIKRLCCVSSNPLEAKHGRTGCINDDENNCESNITKDYSSEKAEIDCEAAQSQGTRRLMLADERRENQKKHRQREQAFSLSESYYVGGRYYLGFFE